MAIIRVILVCILAFTFSCTQSISASNDKVINQAINLINNKRQVEAYLLLKENESSFYTPQDKCIYDFLAAKVLKKAFYETADDYYSTRYIKHLEAACTFIVEHYTSFQILSSDAIWKNLADLSEYYKQTQSENFEDLMKTIQHHNLPLSEKSFKVFQDYFIYNLNKRTFWGITEISRLGFSLCNKPTDNKDMAVKALHTSIIGQLHHTQDFKKGDIYEQEIFYKLNLVDSLYECHQTRMTSDVIHRLGDWAGYYSIIGKRKKAERLLNEEHNLIIAQYGEYSIEYAWYLYHKAFIEKLNHKEENAKEILRQAKILFCKFGEDEENNYKYKLISQDYNALLDFNEQDTTEYSYPLTYYQDKIRKLPSDFCSTNKKLLQLNEVKMKLMTCDKLPTSTIISALDAIIKLSLTIPETDEFVALPGDLVQLHSTVGNKDEFNLISAIIENGINTTAELDIKSTLIILLKNKSLNLLTLQHILDLYTNVMLSTDNWRGAITSLRLAIALNDGKNRDDIKLTKHLAQMARCQQEINQSDSCNIYLKRCERMIEKINHKENSCFLPMIETYHHLSKIYELRDDVKKKLKYSEYIIEQGRDNFNTLPYYFEATYQKALEYYKIGKYAESARLMSPVCSANERDSKIDNYHGLLIESLCQLKDCKAYKKLQKYMDYTVNTIIPVYFSTISQFKRDSLWSAKASHLIHLNTIFAKSFSNDRYTVFAYDNIIFAKSLDIHFEKLLRETIANCGESQKSLFMQMQIAKDSLNFGSPQHKIFYKNRIAFAQSTLPIFINKKQKKELLNRNFYSYLKNLKKNTAILEFVTLRNGNTTEYYAYITQKGDAAPKLIRVTSQEKLAKRISMDHNKINALYLDPFLYEEIWIKIRDVLNPEINNIFLIPTGQLNRINFNAIADPTGKPLSDFITFNRITTSSSLLKRDYRPRFKKDIDVALFGGIHYQLSNEELEYESIRYGGNDKPIQRAFSTNRKKLGFLGYTQTEINRIEKILKSTPLKVKKFLGSEGSESAFKSLNRKSPMIIHIATHGFYLEEDREKHTYYNKNRALRFTDKSLLYSGLLMAGAQSAWDGKLIPKNIDDGILTADEISRMDLSQTELVVLSACETALGDINDTEGVLGLQRAFKKADANFIVMSLWPVNDAPTALLMSYFYDNIKNNMKLNDSLKEAMRCVREKYPNPVDWAGFVLIR